MKKLKDAKKKALATYKAYLKAEPAWKGACRKYEKVCEEIAKDFIDKNLPKGTTILFGFDGGSGCPNWKEFAFFSGINQDLKNWNVLIGDTWAFTDLSTIADWCTSYASIIPIEVKSEDGLLPISELRNKLKELSDILGFQVEISFHKPEDLSALKKLDGTVYHRDDIEIEGDFYNYVFDDGEDNCDDY